MDYTRSLSRRIWWDSLPAVVRERMEGSRIGLDGVTVPQALVLELRCRLAWSRANLGLVLGLARGQHPRARSSAAQTVWRWEAGRSVPRRRRWSRMAALAREHGMPERLIRALERMGEAGH